MIMIGIDHHNFHLWQSSGEDAHKHDDKNGSLCDKFDICLHPNFAFISLSAVGAGGVRAVHLHPHLRVPGHPEEGVLIHICGVLDLNDDTRKKVKLHFWCCGKCCLQNYGIIVLRWSVEYMPFCAGCDAIAQKYHA
jgi:hypothetical protein